MRSYPFVFLLMMISTLLNGQVLRNKLPQNKSNLLQHKIFTAHPVSPLAAIKDTAISYSESILPELSSERFFIDEGTMARFKLYPQVKLSAGDDMLHDDYALNTSAGFRTTFRYKQKLGFEGEYSFNYFGSFDYVNQFINEKRVFPGQGIPEGNTYHDVAFYLNWHPSPYFHFEGGFDEHFIGKGYRSLFLSEEGYNYPYFRITTNIWKFKYMSLWTKNKDIRDRSLNRWSQYPDKYTAIHYLSWQLHPNFRLGFYEALVWQGSDASGKRGFEINYLNPIIFFRPVEFNIGSPDNAMMGVDMDYQTGNNLFYFQLMLDEFKLEEMRAMNGWWGNKQAFQIGWRGFDIFNTNHLNGLLEYNYLRPFMYSHRTPLQSYGHFNQPLAHPLGANTMEAVLQLSYSMDRWYFRLRSNYALYGTDPDGKNYGGDIFRDYDARTKEYHNYVGQGNTTNLLGNVLYASYLLNEGINLHAFARLAHRSYSSETKTTGNLFIQLGVSTFFEDAWLDYQ